MTHTAVAIGRDAPYKEIVALMDQWKVSALPVLEGEGRVVGVVSEADLLPKEAFRDTELGPERGEDALKAVAVRAGDLMSSPAVTVHAGASLAEAARIMARRRVKRLPVVNEIGMLEGVVSRSDLLKVFLREDGAIAADIRRSVLGGAAFTGLDVTVTEGVATLSGALSDRSLVPLLARAARAVEGVVDVRMELGAHEGAS
ncbi:CBS domain-containing protein [Streptomyces sp. R302]|uniref:CBS domain-containing protein n=1 Tax=unclassified Streptomyces TaxID=2593676 RepID=UPI00145C706F|nr:MULTISPECIES: CBS domain-containing protein [unclassified Streptomyces]NML51077.1 CBS domain-containing protein [Streptomyces sp. R301]NML81172.1 CBS domain-containing protein [Streptomyces sp. R302]